VKEIPYIASGHLWRVAALSGFSQLVYQKSGAIQGLAVFGTYGLRSNLHLKAMITIDLFRNCENHETHISFDFTAEPTYNLAFPISIGCRPLGLSFVAYSTFCDESYPSSSESKS
jgi:hypothetical protein